MIENDREELQRTEKNNRGQTCRRITEDKKNNTGQIRLTEDRKE